MIILECSHFALYALDIYIFSVFNIWVVFFLVSDFIIRSKSNGSRT